MPAFDTTPKPVDHPSATEFAAQLASSIKGKTVLVTGASPQSLAGTFLTAIASHGPAQLILAGRAQQKLDQTAAAIAAAAPGVPTRSLIVDLEDLGSVRAAAATVNGWADVPAIDVLVLNAGIMGVAYGTTRDGFERQFGVNHVAQFLFANLVMHKVLAAPGGGRIVVISSDGHATSPLRANKDEILFKNGAGYNRWLSYGQSKTANALFAQGLATRLGGRGLQAYSLHPGAIAQTGLGGHVEPEMWGDFMNVTEGVRQRLSDERRKQSTNVHTKYHDWSNGLPFKSMEDGSATYVVAAFDPTLKSWNGGYLQNGKLDKQSVEEWATDPKEADRLWAVSEELVGDKFSY